MGYITGRLQNVPNVNDIQKQINDLKDKDIVIEAALTDETKRATKKEGEISENLAAEVERATTKEADLEAALNTKITAADVDSGQAAANLVLVSDGHGGASWQQVPGIGEINTALDDINGEVI